MLEEYQPVASDSSTSKSAVHWSRVKAIFDMAVTLESSEWPSFLELRCGDDEYLRQEVESLLAAHESSTDFLEGSLISAESLAAIGNASKPDVPVIGTRIGAYELEREVGCGGMGTVYLANRADQEFRMRVAIKLMRVEKQSSFTIRRFRQERQILARLEHPYVARLIDGGTTEQGMPYLVMEYVEGEILTHYCDSQGLAAVERCVLFLKICSAVSYAHERNIIHRDLKPANILVEQSGNPKLLDFGIAKLLEPESSGASKEATLAGVRMLTPAYASPEQLRGDGVTTRSDVYSLGVILYELLCGERPSLKTVQQSSEREGKQEEHLAPNLRAIIFNAIRLEPSERYESVAALAEDIERYLKGVPTSASSENRIPREPDQISIGVLPFRELGHDTKADPYLRSAITDALITRLSKVTNLSVRPTSAVLPYSEPKRAAHAARELRVRYLLEGTFHTIGDCVRLNVQLVSSETGLAVWAANFEEQSNDLLRLEDSISEQITYALLPQLVGDEHLKLSNLGTASRKAHEAYLRGRYHWSRSAAEPEELAKSIVCFMQAITEDPNYARAHAGVADYYLRLGLWGGVPPDESFAAGLNAARKALELDSGLSEAHASVGFCTWALNRDYATAEKELNIAIALRPDSANAHHWFGLLNSARNRPELALANLNRARKIDPNSPAIAAALGFVYYNARQYTKSLELLNIAARERKNSGLLQEMLTWCYLQLGDTARALEFAHRAVKLNVRNPPSLAALAGAEAAVGNRSAVLDVLKEIEEARAHRYVSPYDRASIYLALDDFPKALKCLEESFAARDWWLFWIGVDPRWDRLRDLPEFASLVARTQPAETVEKTETAPLSAAKLNGLRRSAFVAAVICLVAVLTYLVWLLSRDHSPPFSNPELARITGSGTAGLAAISPNGEYIVYTTAKKGWTQFWRREIGSSASTTLTAPLEGDVVSLQFTDSGKQIAFGLHPTLQPFRQHLFLAPASGGPPTQVLGELSGPVGLSHDGSRAALVRANRSLNRDELAVVDLKTGGERILTYRAFPDHLSWQTPPAWSADGTLIAFPVETKDRTGFVIEIDTVNMAGVVSRHRNSPRWTWVEHLTWVKNKSALAVVARQPGSSFRQLWYIAFPKGPAIRLGGDIESYTGASASDSGATIVSVQMQTLTNIYLAPSRDVRHPVQVTPGSGRYFDLSWTFDGRLLYASDSTGEADIWSLNPDDSEQRQITFGKALNWAPVASPDGKYLAFHSNLSGSWNIWRADRDGTHALQITHGPRDSNWPHFTQDSRNILFHQTDPKGSWSIWSVGVNGGTPVQLTTRMTTHPAVSPKDGRIVAWYSETAENGQWKLAIFGPHGGEPLKIFTPAVAITPDSQLAWSPSGDAITCMGQQNGVWNLWMQPIDGRPAWRLTSFTSGQIYSFDWSKDGRLAFSQGITTTDVVMIRDRKGSS